MDSMKIVAVLGMAGSGKSEVARIFEKNGYRRVRFGDITDEELLKRGLELSEENERRVREDLREEHGMSAYARLNLPRIEEAVNKSSVVIDGLYSWEEYLFLKEKYGDNFLTVAVWTSPATRYRRLNRRIMRKRKADAAASRDRAEIENLNKGGPIAMADYTLCNEGSRQELKKAAEYLLEKFV